MRRFIATVVTFFAFVLPAAIAAPAYAQGVVFGNNDICNGQAGGASGCKSDKGNPVNQVLVNAVELASLIAGVVCVIFVVVGGVLFVTSAGDPDKAKTARNTIIYALVGALVASVANGIVGFIGGKLNP